MVGLFADSAGTILGEGDLGSVTVYTISDVVEKSLVSGSQCDVIKEIN